MNTPEKKHWFDVSSDEWRELLRHIPNRERQTKTILWLVTVFLTPITLAGALLGYVRAYMRFLHQENEPVQFYPMRPVVRVAMFIGSALIWVVLIGLILSLIVLLPKSWVQSGAILYYIGINAIGGLTVFVVFKHWLKGINRSLEEGRKFGTAKFARTNELQPFIEPKGFYIGGGYHFNDKGHLITVAGTRGGKGTNLIIPNLLGISDVKCSWVVIDPKGENAAITARYQRECGQSVVILNPWGLLPEELGNGQSYNPLDILSDTQNVNLVDDAQMIAEMIVPINTFAKGDAFFTDNSRAIVSGLILHMATYEDVPVERSLKTLWEWVRLQEEEWDKLIEDMHSNDHELFGNTVRQAANEIEKLMKSGDKTWGNIIATVLQCTDFIKSPALQKAMKTEFDPKTLPDGATTLYVIIPADKLQSHARWLRLVVTTTMRAVIRNPNKKVAYLLDEFAALGYLPEIETALSTYAGYGVTVWPILQSLIQLKANYKDNWETFIGNSAVRHFFSVNDNFTAEYVSKAIGKTSNVMNERSLFGIEKSQSNERELVTPDELRRASGENIFAFITNKPVTYYPKRPYHEMPELIDNGKKRYDENPYFK